MNEYINIFKNLSAKGFELDKNLIWNFFFFSTKSKNLDLVIKELEGFNYISIVEKKSKNDFLLKVTKIEILTPLKLQKRLIAFRELAEYCNVNFDGWEVEK